MSLSESARVKKIILNCYECGKPVDLYVGTNPDGTFPAAWQVKALLTAAIFGLEVKAPICENCINIEDEE